MSVIRSKDQIITTRKQRDFTQIENCTIRDKQLPLAAKGLLLILISLAADQKSTMIPLTIRQVSKYCKESKSTVARIMNILIEQGFAYRNQSYQAKGRFSTVQYVIYETRELYKEAIERARLQAGSLGFEDE